MGKITRSERTEIVKIWTIIDNPEAKIQEEPEPNGARELEERQMNTMRLFFAEIKAYALPGISAFMFCLEWRSEDLSSIIRYIANSVI